MAMTNTLLEANLKAAIQRLVDALQNKITQLESDKLGRTEQAADSLLLEGKTLTEILAMSGVTPDDFYAAPLNIFTGTDHVGMAAYEVGEWSGPAPIADMGSGEMVALGLTDAFLYVSVAETIVGGQPAKVVTRRVEIGNAAKGGDIYLETFTVTVDPEVVVGTGFRRIITKDSLDSAILAVTGGSNLTLQAISDALDAFIANKATDQEAIDGVDNEKYITALTLKTKVDSAITALVDGAPLALDTLRELAEALGNNEDAIAALTLVIDTKLGKTEQAADSAKFDGKTLSEVIDLTRAGQDDFYNPPLDVLAGTAHLNMVALGAGVWSGKAPVVGLEIDGLTGHAEDAFLTVSISESLQGTDPVFVISRRVEIGGSDVSDIYVEIATVVNGVVTNAGFKRLVTDSETDPVINMITANAGEIEALAQALIDGFNDASDSLEAAPE